MYHPYKINRLHALMHPLHTHLASPVPEATSSNLVFGGAFNMATNSLFHSRCNPIDMRSFIRSYFSATLANTSFTALRGRRGGVAHRCVHQHGAQTAKGGSILCKSVKYHSLTFCVYCLETWWLNLTMVYALM